MEPRPPSPSGAGGKGAGRLSLSQDCTLMHVTAKKITSSETILLGVNGPPFC